jgi:DNA-binding beta-propeller fold protein YncE
LKAEKYEIAEKIKAQTEMIMEVLKNQEKELLQDLQRIYSHKEDVLIKNKERLHNRLELIKRTCRFTEIAINDGDEVQVLIFEKYARKRLEELSRAEVLIPASEGHCRYYVAGGSPGKAENLLGNVVCSAAEPNQCEAEGEGLRRAVVGQDSCFLVNVKEKDGTPLTNGGDDVQAQITTTRDETVEVRVRDHDNGTYTITYSPNASGELIIAVRVYGEPIKTPDCKVHAVCQRDYEKIEKPLLTISRVTLSGKESTLKLPCGVAVDNDNQGRILVADCHNHSIKIFSRDGKFIKSFGCFGTKNGQLNNPTDIAVNDGKIYVCDKDNSRIQCFTSEGVFLTKFSRGSTQLKRPWGLCIDCKGRVVVADTKNNKIQVFSSDGNFVTSFGKEGSGESEFQQPYFVTSHPNGQIYVTDNGNHRVQVFDESYCYLFQFGGEYDALRLKYPTGITTDNQGHVIVADQCNSRLQAYQADGKHKVVISKPFLNTSQYQSYPKGLAVSLDGYVVVADSDNDRVVLI